jgi:hypothetical protein
MCILFYLFIYLYSENISQILMNFDMGKYNKNPVENFILSHVN